MSATDYKEIMYATLAPDVLQLLLIGTTFSVILFPIQNRIVGSYNRRISRKLLKGA